MAQSDFQLTPLAAPGLTIPVRFSIELSRPSVWAAVAPPSRARTFQVLEKCSVHSCPLSESAVPGLASDPCVPTTPRAVWLPVACPVILPHLCGCLGASAGPHPPGSRSFRSCVTRRTSEGHCPLLPPQTSASVWLGAQCVALSGTHSRPSEGGGQAVSSPASPAPSASHSFAGPRPAWRLRGSGGGPAASTSARRCCWARLAGLWEV